MTRSDAQISPDGRAAFDFYSMAILFDFDLQMIFNPSPFVLST